MNEFSTYLYVKQHKVTKKLYFGKTTKDPLTYRGSGLHWLRHIKQHGTKDVETIWFQHFNNRDECVKFAIEFSIANNIVNSSDWLNLKVENGLDGGGRDGTKHSQETKIKMSLARKGKKQSKDTVEKRMSKLRGKPLSDSHKQKISLLRQGTTSSEETKKKISESLKGLVHSDISKLKMSEANKLKRTCPHCNLTGGTANMSRYHFEKCKYLR